MAVSPGVLAAEESPDALAVEVSPGVPAAEVSPGVLVVAVSPGVLVVAVSPGVLAVAVSPVASSGLAHRLGWLEQRCLRRPALKLRQPEPSFDLWPPPVCFDLAN